MNNTYMGAPISTPPKYTDIPYNPNNYYPGNRMTNRAGQANLREMRIQGYVPNSEYYLSPFEQQFVLTDERYRRQAMLQRERDRERRRRLVEQPLYSTMGSIGSTAGREFIRSLFL